MIRVLHILSTITGGGVERRRLSLAKYLDKEKFSMKLIGTHKAGFIAEQIEENGVEIIEVGDFSGPFHWEKHKKVQEIIEDFKPHIIHGAVYEGVTMAAVNGFLKKVPVLILEETSDPQNRSAKASFLLRIFSFAADKFIAISPNVENYLTGVAKISKHKVKTITNGVEIPRQVSAEEVYNLKKHLQITEKDFVIGSVGRLFNGHKKITDIVEAIFLLRNPNLRLLIVGDGPDEQLVREKVREKGLEGQVIFVGYQFDTAPYYQLMDIFCIVSQREGFGLVAAEAMLHQLPVVASNVGGLKDVVIDGETGFLVPTGLPNKVAEKIQILIGDHKLRKLMGQKGRLRALEKFTALRYCKEVEELYLELLKSKNIKWG